jgi:AraC-like DNA-binding protein
MDRAQHLLESGIGIKEIAHRLGFASPGNFSTAFRRATGVSPRQFRSTMRSYAN